MEQKLRAIGLPVDDLPRLPAADGPAAARARRPRPEAAARNLIGAGEQPVRQGPGGGGDPLRRDATPGRRDGRAGRARRSSGTSPTPSRGTSRCARAARSPPPDPRRTPTSCCAPRCRAWPTSRPGAPTRCACCSPAACGPRATCASCRGSGASSARRPAAERAPERRRGSAGAPDPAGRGVPSADLRHSAVPCVANEPRTRRRRARRATRRATASSPARSPCCRSSALVVVAWQVWSSALGWSDLSSSRSSTSSTGLGMTVGFHRLFTHRSFKTGARPCAPTLAIARLGGDRGPGHRLGRRPPQAPRVLRPAGRPAQPARRPRQRARRRAARAPARARRLAVPPHAARREGRATRPTCSRDPVVALGRPHVRPVGGRRACCVPVRPGLADRRLARRRRSPGCCGAALVRMLVLHHVTYSINSLCHFFGRRRFETGDESRNLPVARAADVRRGVAQQPPRVPDLGRPRHAALGGRPVGAR